MQNKLTKDITLSGLFIAIGLILPILLHSIGAGTMLLPMHIPVLIAGFCVSLPFAAAVGILTPILSSLVTGMPPVFPVLPFMIFELLTYAVVANILFRKFKLNAYVALIGSMIAGRVVSSIVVWILASFFAAKLPSPITFMIGSVTGGIPGIIIQLLIIPPIIMILRKNNFIKNNNN